MKFLLPTLALVTSASAADETTSLLADKINSLQNNWVAHTSSHYQDKYSSSLLESHPLAFNSTVGYAETVINLSLPPTAYDFRSEYSSCQSPNQIFDQGSCGGCWGLSVAATMSDRFCQQDVDVVLSPQELLDCVSGNSRGCNGGFTEGQCKYIYLDLGF